MKTPPHLCQLPSAPTQRDCETVQVVTRSEERRATPVFRAPALPTRQPFYGDLSFNANFGPRLRERP